MAAPLIPWRQRVNVYRGKQVWRLGASEPPTCAVVVRVKRQGDGSFR